MALWRALPSAQGGTALPGDAVGEEPCTALARRLLPRRDLAVLRAPRLGLDEISRLQIAYQRRLVDPDITAVTPALSPAIVKQEIRRVGLDAIAESTIACEEVASLGPKSGST